MLVLVGSFTLYVVSFDTDAVAYLEVCASVKRDLFRGKRDLFIWERGLTGIAYLR